MITAEATLPLHVAVSLAAGLVQAVCDEAGARAMFVKGPAAIAQGLREPRSSADIDVIIDPARFESVVAALTSRGWLARFTQADELRAIAGHSVTLVHPDWPCDLDLHHFFVGTFAVPAVTFEALIDGAETHLIGNRPICTPSLVGHRLVLTVNTVRGLGIRRADDEAAALAAHFRANPEDWRAQVALASRTRSLSVLHEFAQRQNLPDPGGDLSRAELKQLDFVMYYQSRGFGNLRYRLEDRDLSLGQKVKILAYYLYKPASVIQLENPSFPGGQLATLKANLVRLGKGIKQWRDAREIRAVVDGNRLSPPPERATPAVRPGHAGFNPGLRHFPLPYADLRVNDGNVVISNAARTDAGPGVDDGAHFARNSAAVLEPAECAEVQDGETRYVLPVGPAAFARGPRSTPGVFRLDPSGQELLDLVKDGVATSQNLVEEIARRHEVETSDIEAGISEFLRKLLEAGVVVRADGA